MKDEKIITVSKSAEWLNAYPLKSSNLIRYLVISLPAISNLLVK